MPSESKDPAYIAAHRICYEMLGLSVSVETIMRMAEIIRSTYEARAVQPPDPLLLRPTHVTGMSRD